ncbi:MAG TPA: hypothetical protein VM573_04405 [Actinomycetota bacterium]|jgi:hypothetical protein|nr:hypothetical protein [Actinomycetota bacterium]
MGDAKTPRDAGNWAQRGTDLHLGDVPADAINLNVEGRSVAGPVQGFGKLWQKTYRVVLPPDVEPAGVISAWKSHFPEFWPPKNHFYGNMAGINPGDVALINMGLPGRMKLSTGILVMYADDESFTFMTPQGHMFAGWITFSAHSAPEGTVAQAQVLMRASDPLYEIGLAFGGHRQEDRFWEHTLTMLARHFGAECEVDMQRVCVDKKRQWKRAGNLKHNAAIRSTIYMLGTPFRRRKA